MRIMDIIKKTLKGFIKKKPQLSENFNLHIGNNYYVHLPPGTDISKIQSSKIPPEMELEIVEIAAQYLEAQGKKITALPEMERNKIIVGATIATTIEILEGKVHDKVGLKEVVEVELS